jgi:cyclic pyranopterin phosphate synthase
MQLRDSYNRTIRDLRISVTDRCNFRCFYCLPNGEPTIARKDKILTFEEMSYIADIFVDLGITKIRLTGGEPLMRKDIADLAASIARLKPRLHDLALTTNGYIFPQLAEKLRTAGVDRVTLSLDSLDPDRFMEITGIDGLEKVFASIDAARRVGFDPVKINTVVIRGHNDSEIVDLARFARENAVSMRFIEFMPLDAGHEWKREMVVSGREIRDTIEKAYPLKLKSPTRGSETAWKYTFADGSPGEIGIIAPVTEIFCGACSRIRLTADGQIRTCLFSTVEHNLRDVIRSGSSRDEITQFIESVTLQKEARHHINDPHFVQPARTMSFIGG